ncbi:MAG: hypothetical protein ACI9UA_006165 [Pseudoalteromonas tetraodonis]|jgi:hypothetical protein
MRAFVRWDWISYQINSDYLFLDVLPPREKVPFLIDWCVKKGDHIGVAHSQLVTMTRVNFGEMRHSDKKKRDAEIDAWRKWWNVRAPPETCCGNGAQRKFPLARR